MEVLNKIMGSTVDKVYSASLGDEISDSINKLESGAISDKETLIRTIVEISVPMGVICLILLVVYAAYLLMSSQGNPDKLQEGKEIITNAVIGFLIVLLSVGILLLISNTLGLGIYN